MRSFTGTVLAFVVLVFVLAVYGEPKPPDPITPPPPPPLPTHECWKSTQKHCEDPPPDCTEQECTNVVKEWVVVDPGDPQANPPVYPIWRPVLGARCPDNSWEAHDQQLVVLQCIEFGVGGTHMNRSETIQQHLCWRKRYCKSHPEDPLENCTRTSETKTTVWYDRQGLSPDEGYVLLNGPNDYSQQEHKWHCNQDEGSGTPGPTINYWQCLDVDPAFCGS